MKTVLFALIITNFIPSGEGPSTADVHVVRSQLTSDECVRLLKILGPDTSDHAVTSCAYDEGF